MSTVGSYVTVDLNDGSRVSGWDLAKSDILIGRSDYWRMNLQHPMIQRGAQQTEKYYDFAGPVFPDVSTVFSLAAPFGRHY